MVTALSKLKISIKKKAALLNLPDQVNVNKIELDQILSIVLCIYKQSQLGNISNPLHKSKGFIGCIHKMLVFDTSADFLNSEQEFIYTHIPTEFTPSTQETISPAVQDPITGKLSLDIVFNRSKVAIIQHSKYMHLFKDKPIITIPLLQSC